MRIFAVLVLSLITALSTIAVPCKAEETRHITIQFDGGGATAGTMETITLNDGNSAMAIPENKFERNGYLFSHWYITDGKNTYTALDGAIPHDFVARQGDYWSDYAKNSNTLTLIAQWECVVSDDYYEFTVPTSVTLNKSNDKLSTTIDVKATAKERKWLKVGITSTNNFSLVGKSSKAKLPYTLSETSFEMQPQYPIGTDTEEADKTLTVSAKASDGKIADDYTDTVNFEVTNVYDTRTIVFDCNGGNVNGESEISYTVRDGSSYGKLPVPTKSGAEFLAWKDENGNTIYSGSTVSPNTEKLIATYQIIYRLSVSSTMNGMSVGFMGNTIFYDFYKNGQAWALKSTSDHIDMYEGDTFEVKNIQTGSDYYYVGLWGKEDSSRFEYEKDDNGKVIGIKGTVNPDLWPALVTTKTVGFTFNFKPTSELCMLTDTVDYRSIVFDLDTPSGEVNDVAVFSQFASKASAYLDGTTLHVYNPDGGKVVAGTSIKSLLAGTKITSADMRGLDTSNVVNATNVFRACNYLQSVNVDSWNTENITNISDMFNACVNLKTVNLNSWNTRSLKDMHELFDLDHNLESVYFSDWDVSHVTTFMRLFEGCNKLTTVDISKWDTSSVTSMSVMFNNCYNLGIDVSNLNTQKVTSMNYMFAGTDKIKGLEKLDTSNVTSMDYMFDNYRGESLDLSNFNTEKVKSASYMFANMSNMEELDLSSFSFRNLSTVPYMFYNSKRLKTIYVSAGFEKRFGSSNNMFRNCVSLIGGKGTTYDDTFFDGTAARIDGGPNSPGYFTDIADKPNSVATQALVIEDDPAVVEDNVPQIEEYELSEEDLSYYSEDNIPPADTLPGWQEEYTE